MAHQRSTLLKAFKYPYSNGGLDYSQPEQGADGFSEQSPPSDKAKINNDSDTANETEKELLCAWCGQAELGDGAVKGHVHGQGPSQVFCSELCFSQCRRAAFKRAKVCHWCKHIRHTVTYVDFHDGDHQLQFCGDKCLNQYKMHLFCKEATSLGIEPKTHVATANEEITKATTSSPGQNTLLITPDLWLQNCSHSPESNSQSMKNDSDSELRSIDSDVEDHETEDSQNKVLDLANYSFRNKGKRKMLANEPDIPSKKGKSHQIASIPWKIKPTPSSETMHQQSKPLNLLKSKDDNPSSENFSWLDKQIVPEYGLSYSSHFNPWPANLQGFPYPQIPHSGFLPSSMLPPHLFGLGNQLLKLNLANMPSSCLPMSSSRAVTTAAHGQFPNSITVEEKEPKNKNVSATQLISLENKEKEPFASKIECGSSITEKDNIPKDVADVRQETRKESDFFQKSSFFPPSHILTPYPVLIPLPIPVPIPIPLNIHEKYLKHLQT